MACRRERPCGDRLVVSRGILIPFLKENQNS